MNDALPPSLLAAAKKAQENLPPPPAGGPPEAGDLVVGPLPKEANELAAGLEWALIEKDPTGTERFLAVPADGLTLRGSADLEVGRGGEKRSLRCRFAVWLEKVDANWRKTGRLSPTELAKTRRQLQELAQGEELGHPLSQDVELSADYREEIAERLEKLVLLLRESPQQVAAPPLKFPGNTSSPKPANGQGLRAWATAATLLVGLLGVLFTGKLLQVEELRQEQEALREKSERQIEELKTSEARLHEETSRLERERSAALGEAATTRQDLEATRETLKRAREESVIANPELAILSRPGSTRGATKVELEEGASHLLVLIPIDDRREKRKYRIELIGGHEPWTSPELEVLSPGELRLGIPASLLPEGKVVLRLLDSKKDLPLTDYELEIGRVPRRN